MTEQKHFKYDGNVHINDVKVPELTAEEPEVTEVEFLTPAKITYSVGDEKRTEMVNVDIINRKVYDRHGSERLSDAVFKHLDDINTLPADFFKVDEDIAREAADVRAEADRIKKQQLGEANE